MMGQSWIWAQCILARGKILRAVIVLEFCNRAVPVAMTWDKPFGIKAMGHIDASAMEFMMRCSLRKGAGKIEEVQLGPFFHAVQ